ncbi:MAG: hypothetical protein UU47_C0003G0001 [candidate division TM6 bacterium GW2011_GWE2_41_16]|nr:MAG: hypothetical protein UU47_C0003G0001 [candidate division TM6 bacterium GW2011_GWE2_41_16]
MKRTLQLGALCAALLVAAPVFANKDRSKLNLFFAKVKVTNVLHKEDTQANRVEKRKKLETEGSYKHWIKIKPSVALNVLNRKFKVSIPSYGLLTGAALVGATYAASQYGFKKEAIERRF